MGVEINQERVNDRAKLLMHRIIARRLGEDSSLVRQAHAALERQAERMPGRDFLNEWRVLLSASVLDLRRQLTRRDETMDRLRLSSPFMSIPGVDLTDVTLRRRIWRKAKRGLNRFPEPSSEISDAAPRR